MRAALLAVLSLLLLPALASAGTVVSVRGASGPGPARYDRVSYERFGPASAKRVLILVPGTQGGAGDFSLVGPEIVKRVKGLQVWAYDRRSQALEDHSGFASGNPDTAFKYYLGGGGFVPASAPFARDWGLKLALEDLRAVVKRARRGGRKVILGGHSLGASTAVAYAAWDFKGRPGYRDLSGLVLIDGGLLGTLAPPKLADVKQRVAALRTGDPFLDLLGIGVPWAAGVFSDLAGLYAKVLPDARATFIDYPAIPAALKRAGPGHQRGRARLRVRRVHLPGRAVADPRARGRARDERRPAAVAERRGDADRERREAVRPLAGRRGRVVLPAAALARRPGRGPARPQRGRRTTCTCASGTSAGSTCRCTRSRPACRAGACCAGRGGWWRRRTSRRGR